MTTDPPTRQMLEEALLKIAKSWNLVGTNAADYKQLALIEGYAHELAHALDLGPSFEHLIEAMPNETANSHEASALRIEIAALTALGVHLSVRRLQASANWAGSTISTILQEPLRRLWSGVVGIPSCAQLRAPLSWHERHCVKRFVAMVRYEVKLLTKNARTDPNNLDSSATSANQIR